MKGSHSQCGWMEKASLAYCQIQKAFPPHLLPETEKQIGRQGIIVGGHDRHR
jgi:hypothetical protein